MKKLAKVFKYILRICGVALIGINLFRLFDKLSYFDWMQNAPVAIANSFLIIGATYLQDIMKKLGFKLSDGLFVIVMSSVTVGLMIGMVLKMYYYVPGLDSLMHFTSGGVLTIIGLSVLNMMVDKETTSKLSPLFIVLFAFSFSMMVGAVWEIFEYTVDGLFNDNMQRFKDVVTGELFVGREALKDTMKDMILNTIGAILVSVPAFFDIKKGGSSLDKLLITKIDSKELN